MEKLNETIALFQSMDNEYRLQMLLDYADQLPPLPERYRSAAEIEAHRLHECMTPVSIWVEIQDGKIHLFADVPRESPTVRGFISLLMTHFNGEKPEAILQAPRDILQRSGLASTLGMRRNQGLSAVIQRIREAVAKQMANANPKD